MKCPGCEFVCSDLRDICPKCLLDLRPQKEILGIQVTSPEASYEELLQGAIPASERPRPQPAAGGLGSIWKSLKGALSRPRAAEAPPPTSCAAQPAPSAHPSHSEPAEPAAMDELQIREAIAQSSVRPTVDLPPEDELDTIID